MPITNRSRYGFRWVRAINGGQPPSTEMKWIQTAYSERIRIGDPVKVLTDGSIAISAGGGTDTYGIVVGGGYYWDGTNLIPAKFVPGATAWGTVWERRSRLLVMPAKDQLFEIDVDDQANTTHAAYAALEGANSDHVLSGSGDNDATPVLDADAVATAAQWRIIESPAQTLENEDLAGANVKVRVTINETAQAPSVFDAGV